ncbi:unnamed protein product [Urochloa decumbens]|uniref:DUF1618 domain-containing protein n=1 Tax=Urochloa decumbens TaxID=240449 RepID=A0ABC9B5G6_9POAL
MEVSTAQLSPGSPSAAYPRWVMLEQDNKSRRQHDSSYFKGDPNTLATGRTTTGHQIQATFRFADPPASSRVCVQLQAHPSHAVARDIWVIAAHGDSVLIQVTVIQDPNGYRPGATIDHFVYSAGDAAAVPPWPPSLSLLPPYYIGKNYSSRPRSRELSTRATGLVRRGEDEFVVAELTMATMTKDDTPELRADELLLFRSGEWIVIKSPVIRNGDPEFGELHANSFTNVVVPVGDRLLCWVNQDKGLLLCDVFEESPILEYVKLPVDPCPKWPPGAYRNVCATTWGAVLKLVNVFPRCCCGGEGTTDCERSEGACVINTWTLRMDDMEWVKDGMVDATELWASDTYEGLPHLTLAHPVVSVDEPHVICFAMIQDDNTPSDDKTVWKLMVDMRSKTIQSFSCHPGALRDRYHTCKALVPSSVTYFLNSCRASSSNRTSYSKGAQSKVEIERSPVQVTDGYASNCKSSEEPVVQASEILTALQEIPSYGLDRDDMLKATCRILCHGNGRRFKTLLSLPPNLRKDWLLMEIKACED